MELAWTDRRRVRDRVTSRLRSGDLALGDVLALDALVEPAIAALRTNTFRSSFAEGVELRSASALPVFLGEFKHAVRDASGSAFEQQFDAIESALTASTVVGRCANDARKPVDEVDVVIESWLGRIAGNDRATAAHSRAVGSWSTRIAQRLSLDRDMVTFVTRCGVIHDVGKLYTPHDVLLAARRLNDAEWAVMQKHVLDGWSIADDVVELRPFAPAIRGHHERFDGRGYPDGLIAEGISLATRIVTVADSFNAMIADRPYRPPMSPMAAIEELERHRGKQFDPDCVDAMIDVVLART